MATEKKPAAKSAARKPAAKRGPTKAAALKALGLTQEDLNALKELRERQNEVPQIEVETPDFSDPATARALLSELIAKSEPIPEGLAEAAFTDEEIDAALAAKNATKAERPLAEDPQAILESRPRPQSEAPALPQEADTAEPVWYMRNLRNMEVSFRLSRQERQGEKRTRLNPRGMRGDIQKLEPGDLQDAQLQVQASYGLIEVINQAEALDVLTKQGTNAQRQPHTPTSLLRNPTGQPYAPENIRTEAEYNSQGIKVADLRPVVEGELGEIVVDRGGIQRELAPQQSQHVQAGIGGNPAILSDGFAAQNQAQLGAVDQTSAARDALARSKNFEGPGAGLGQVAVVIEPTQRT